MTDSAKPHTGGCQCGAVRYEAAGAVRAVYVCHCRECRKQSASAFGISVVVPRAGLRVTRGAPAWWTRPADSGGTVACAFCPACGSRLWHERAAAPDTLSIKGGSLDEAMDLTGAIHIWTSRKLAGIVVPDGAERYPGEPPD